MLDLDTVDGYLRLHRLGHKGGLLVEQHVSGVPVGATHNGLCGIYYDDDGNRYALAFGLPLDGPQNPVYAQYFTYPAEVAPSLMGPTCRPVLPAWEGRDQDGLLVPANDQQIGNQFGWLRVSGTPAGSLHFMLLSTDTAFVPIVHPLVGGGCMRSSAPGPATSACCRCRPAPTWRGTCRCPSSWRRSRCARRTSSSIRATAASTPATGSTCRW
ncbi:MAG: hypothetical protein FJ265_13570 [Planctomycetes bacterium]|nr:hypothetical protein [Planctomycetota bacterium]